MNGDERRKKIINILSSSKSPVAGVALAKELDVSRQVIVQDIALLRANGAAIFSTNRGYLIQAERRFPTCILPVGLGANLVLIFVMIFCSLLSLFILLYPCQGSSYLLQP